MTVTEWLTVMVIDATVLLLWMVGEGLYRQIVQWRTHHRVPHYRFRASRSRRATQVARPASRSNARLGAGTELQAAYWTARAWIGDPESPPASRTLRPTGPGAGPLSGQAGDSRLDRDSATSVESQPASGTPEVAHHPGAGLNLQAGSSCLDRGSVVLPPSDESQPAPGKDGLPGAGPEPRIAVETPDLGGGPGNPVGAGPPEPTPTGPTQPQNLVDLGASLEIVRSVP